MKKIEQSIMENLIRTVVRETLNILNDKIPATGWISEGILHEHDEWIVYEGDEKIITVFKDGSRLSLDIRYPPETWGDDKDKWKHKAASKWKSLARDIYTSAGLSKAGNPNVIPWKICFTRALEDPSMLEFTRKYKSAF